MRGCRATGLCCDVTVTDNDTDPVLLRSVAERLATEAAEFVRRRRVEVFGDPLPGHTLGIVLQGLAFVMVIVASALTPAPVRAAGMTPATASA